MTSPIQSRITGVFIPVRDIEKARDWYARILGIGPGTIHFGHMCSLETEGECAIMLDTMPKWGGKEPGGAPTYQVPAFIFKTEDIQAAYAFMQENGVELVTGIEGHWFGFRDPDGNLLMVNQ